MAYEDLCLDFNFLSWSCCKVWGIVNDLGWILHWVRI